MSDKKSFDTFIFDLDGTILDTLPDLIVVTNEALREQGFPERTRDEVLSFVGNGLVALMYQAVPENTPKDMADQAVACWKRFNLEYDNHLTAPYPHVPETLAELRRRGCKLGVLSNKFDGGVHKIIAQCLPGLFDVEHGECEEIPRKPNPAGLLRTIEELGSTPERTAYLGERHLGRSSRRRLRHWCFVGVPHRAGDARRRIGHHARKLLRPVEVRAGILEPRDNKGKTKGSGSPVEEPLPFRILTIWGRPMPAPAIPKVYAFVA